MMIKAVGFLCEDNLIKCNRCCIHVNRFLLRTTTKQQHCIYSEKYKLLLIPVDHSLMPCTINISVSQFSLHQERGEERKKQENNAQTLAITKPEITLHTKSTDALSGSCNYSLKVVRQQYLFFLWSKYIKIPSEKVTLFLSFPSVARSNGMLYLVWLIIIFLFQG